MKKLMLLFLLIGASTINADIRFDRSTRKYHSIPTAPNIDQNEYDELVKECGLIKLNCQKIGVSEENVGWEIVGYLLRVATPTAMRLIEDLKKIALTMLTI